MSEAAYYKCGDCGYEFLSKVKGPTCPRCKSSKLEAKDIKALTGLDD